MANVKSSVWVGELDRFGCTMTVVGKSEEDVKEALMGAYEKTYRDLNDDADPREDKDERFYDDKSYYDNALEDIFVRELVFGRVEWR